MILYALLGVCFFGGKIENRCRLTEKPINGKWPINENITFLCGVYECPLEYFIKILIFLVFLLI